MRTIRSSTLNGSSNEDQMFIPPAILLIDDLTRSHHKDPFESGGFDPQYELLEKLEDQKIPFMKFDTLGSLSSHKEFVEKAFSHIMGKVYLYINPVFFLHLY